MFSEATAHVTARIEFATQKQNRHHACIFTTAYVRRPVEAMLLSNHAKTIQVPMIGRIKFDSASTAREPLRCAGLSKTAAVRRRPDRWSADFEAIEIGCRNGFPSIVQRTVRLVKQKRDQQG